MPATVAPTLTPACGGGTVRGMTSKGKGGWNEVARITGYGDRNLAVCQEEFAHALTARASWQTGGSVSSAKFECLLKEEWEAKQEELEKGHD